MSVNLTPFVIDINTPHGEDNYGDDPRTMAIKHNGLIQWLSSILPSQYTLGTLTDIRAGTNILIDRTDPEKPIIHSDSNIFTLLGRKGSVGELPVIGNIIGQAWLIGTNLHVWTAENKWENVGAFAANTGEKGEKGDTGDAGVNGLDGINGSNGSDAWNPLIRFVEDNERMVLEVFDWFGGSGEKPETGYIGESGLVSGIGSGVDLKGPLHDDAILLQGTVEDGDIVVFQGTTGLLVKSGGKLGTAAFKDVTEFINSADLTNSIVTYHTDNIEPIIEAVLDLEEQSLSMQADKLDSSIFALTGLLGTPEEVTDWDSIQFTTKLYRGLDKEPYGLVPPSGAACVGLYIERFPHITNPSGVFLVLSATSGAVYKRNLNNGVWDNNWTLIGGI